MTEGGEDLDVTVVRLSWRDAHRFGSRACCLFTTALVEYVHAHVQRYELMNTSFISQSESL